MSPGTRRNCLAEEQRMRYSHESTTSELLAPERRGGRSGDLFPHGLREPKGRALPEGAGMGSPLGMGSYPATVLHLGKRAEFLLKC